MSDGEVDSGTPMFAIFVISLLSLFIIPFSIYKICNAESSEEASKPWETAGKKRAVLKSIRRNLASPSSVVLICGWSLLFALLWYVQHYAKDLAPFDPYDILKLERGATDQDVKKSYRRLSLQYHPDKNPDPEAVPIFLQISQAYRALTDEVARKNWEQFGHPDGKQAMDIGIALPSWLMSDDNKNAPVILATLVIIGVVLPLGLAAWFLFSSSKYMGPNQVMQGTLEIFLRSKFAVKESQSLARIPDTLVFAMEFIMMPTPADQATALEGLRKDVLRSHPELKEKPQWFKRKTSVVKVHMLLLAHMERGEIPPPMTKDLEFVLRKSVVLLEEMVKIANIPRYSPQGWLTPSIGAIEMLQCLTVAVSIGARKTFTHGKAGAESHAPVLQLPHVDMDVIKKLSRKRVRGLGDLLDLAPEDRLATLSSAGLSSQQAQQCVTALLSIPVVSVLAAGFSVEGEEADAQVLEEDIITCSARLLLKRPSHRTPGFVAPKGSSVLAYAPHCPIPREEKWYVILADAANNATFNWSSVSLVEAESSGLAHSQAQAHPSNSLANDSDTALANGSSTVKVKARKGEQAAELLEETTGLSEASKDGQLVELKFRAPRHGKYDLTLYLVSDCWIGCDRTIPLKLKVNELSRAEREGRTMRGKTVPLIADEETVAASEDGDKKSEASDDDSEDEDEYDSEEGSTEESGSDEDGGSSDSQASTTEAPLLRNVEE